MALHSNSWSRRRPVSILLGALVVSIALAPAVRAQSQPAPAAAPDADAAPAAEIVVTGSHIENSGYQSPTPVQVVGQTQIQDLGVTNLGDALFDVPAFRPGLSPTTTGLNSNYIGARFADLRGLGPVRTLVLMDGQRIVPGTELGTVDLNIIPTILMQRTEVVTGGASAAYGSDAVSGVVNVIMDNKFEGAKANIQFGDSGHNDGKNYQAGVAFGTSFAGGKGHVVIGGEFENQQAIGDCYQREWCAAQTEAVTNATPGVNGLPAQVISPGANTSQLTRGGLITSGPLMGTQFSPNGTPEPFTYGQLVPKGLFMIGGSGAGQNAYLTGVDIEVPVERETAYGNLSYDFTDKLTGHVTFNYAKVDGSNEQGAIRDAGNLTIQITNPYIPASVRADMVADGITSFGFGREGVDLGFAQGLDSTDTYRMSAGLDYDLGNSWKIKGYYQFGESDFVQTVSDDPIVPYFNMAVQAVTGPNGVPVCAATVSANAATRAAAAGCQPLDLFGQNQFSAAAKAYAFGTSLQTRDIVESVASTSVQGQPLRTWAGPVSVAVGVDARTDAAFGNADPISKALAFYQGNGNAIDGRINVEEEYAETVIPLLSDLFLAKSWDINGAVRQTHYSTSGSVTTWKIGTEYEPTNWLRFRATDSRDIRAPNISELYDPTTTGLQTIQDSVTHSESIVTTHSGGNKNLTPEKAETLTAGLVLEPEGFLEGARLSVDYFDIRISDAISTLPAQTVVAECNAGQAQYCPLITRDSAGAITLLNLTYQNLNQISTSGEDFVGEYNFALDRVDSHLAGKMNINITASHTAYLTTKSATGSLNDAGVTGCSPLSAIECVPNWTIDGIQTYSLEPFRVSLNEKYITRSRYDPTLVGPLDPGYSPYLTNSVNNNRVAGALYLGTTVSYDLINKPHGKLEIFGGIDNLTDRPPPQLPGRGNPAYFDPIGRYYKIGLRAQM